MTRDMGRDVHFGRSSATANGMKLIGARAYCEEKQYQITSIICLVATYAEDSCNRKYAGGPE